MKLRKIFSIFFIVLNLTLFLIPNVNSQFYETFTENYENEDYILSYSYTYLNTTGDNIELSRTADNSSYSTVYNSSGCQFLYDFEENDTATNVIDVYNLNNGTLTGSGDEYTTQAFWGRALYFDGNTEYIRVSDNVGLDNTAESTVSFWLRLENKTHPPEQWFYRKRSSYGVRMKTQKIDYDVIYGQSATVSINPNQFFYTPPNERTYYFSFVYNSTGELMRYYVNETLVVEDLTSAGGLIGQDTYDLVLGAYNILTYYSNITVDSWAYFSRELSINEIEENFNPKNSEGNITSLNLLGGLHASRIDEMIVNCDISTGGDLDFQFSEDGLNWYDNEGNLNQWTDCDDGENTINLEDLGFTSNIQYKARLTKGLALPTSPKLNSIEVNYQPSMTDLTLIYMVFALVFGMLLTGLLGLIKPIISLATIGVTLMVVLPQLAILDNFLISFAVASLFFQVCFFMIGYARNM